MTTPAVVRVVWEDTVVLDDTTWGDKSRHDGFTWKPFLVDQIGFAIYDGPEGVVVVDSWTSGSLMGPRTQIPRGMIRSVLYVTEPDQTTHDDIERSAGLVQPHSGRPLAPPARTDAGRSVQSAGSERSHASDTQGARTPGKHKRATQPAGQTKKAG